MYHPHNVLWLLPIALACWLGGAVTGLLSRLRPGSVSGRLKFVFIFGFIGCIVSMIVMRNYDDAQERAELRGIDLAGVSHLTLAHAGLKKEITEPASVLAVMSEFKAVQNIGAHHSHPEDYVDVDFEYQQRPYHYHVGRDSDRPLEYWIRGAGGRINSETFGPLIDKLMAQQAEPAPIMKTMK